MRQMIKDGYYDPRDPDVIDLQRNIYAEDEIIALPEINGAKKAESDDVASKASSKWKEYTMLSSISKVVERRKQNPWKPMLENFVAGVSGTIAEQTESPQHELSLTLSDFPGSVGDSAASSVESEIECPERSSTPTPELKDESTQTPSSSSQNSLISLEDLKSQVEKLEDWQKEEKDKDDFFSKASKWLKNNSDIHVALTMALAAYIVLNRRQTIVAIFR